MARHKCIGIRETLTTLLPRAEIERLVQESGAVRRRPKVDASATLWRVLLGFGTGRERTLAIVPGGPSRVRAGFARMRPFAYRGESFS